MLGDFQVICGSMVGKNRWSLASTETPAYVALFDESFNKSAKNGQMELHVCFCGKENYCVVTCCYNAEFLGIAFAQDLYEKFISYQLEIEPNKLLQVSSNRPNVNLVFLDILNRFRQGIEQPHSVKIGTCGLHTVHNN